MQMRPAVVALVFSLFGALTVGAEQSPQKAPSAPRVEVLVLGTFHMAKPGSRHLQHAGRRRPPKRQAEIAQLMTALETFRPTKIAVEATAGDDRIPKRYSEYAAGRYELTRNEIDQIGLRLARQLRHKTLYAVDADGEFPYPRLVKYAKATGRSGEFDALMAEIGEMVKANNSYLASHTIAETLLYLNSDAKVTEDLGFYYREAAFGEPYDWAGADLVSDWFRRNMRIYSNLMGLIDSPNERLLVVYGSGHLGWLQQAVANNPKLRLRKLAEFVR